MTEDEFYATMGEIAKLQKQIDDLHSQMHCLILKMAQELVNRIRYGR